MNNKIYTNLNDCINDVLSLSSNYACEGVEKNIGGPFGAGIIQKIDNSYKIICIERNTVIYSKDATSHAEVNAICQAAKVLQQKYWLGFQFCVLEYKCALLRKMYLI